MNEIQTQLNAALADLERADRNYAETSFAFNYPTGGEGATAEAVNKAEKKRDAARSKVEQLEAALRVYEDRERARVAEEAEAVARAERDAVNAVLAEVQEIGARWDAAVSNLAAISAQLGEASDKLRTFATGGGLYTATYQARSRAMLIIAHQLKDWLGDENHIGRSDAATLCDCLPKPIGG